LFGGVVRQPGMGTGVVLPERAEVPGLPAFDRFAQRFVAGVGIEPVRDGPTTDTGAVGFEVEAALELAGDGAVGGRRFGAEEFGGQGRHFGRPGGVVIAAGNPGRPGFGLALGASAQVAGEELVETGQREPQLLSRFPGGEFLPPMAGQQMPNQGRRATFDQL
jgi:hypothetical protein